MAQANRFFVYARMHRSSEKYCFEHSFISKRMFTGICYVARLKLNKCENTHTEQPNFAENVDADNIRHVQYEIYNFLHSKSLKC